MGRKRQRIIRSTHGSRALLRKRPMLARRKSPNETSDYMARADGVRAGIVVAILGRRDRLTRLLVCYGPLASSGATKKLAAYRQGITKKNPDVQTT